MKTLLIFFLAFSVSTLSFTQNSCSKYYPFNEGTTFQITSYDKKGKKSSVVATSVKKIIVACDAGMGSSAMGASKLKNKVKKAGLDIEVYNTAINDLPSDVDIVITHNKLTDRAKAAAPNATHIALDDFIMTDVYDKLVEELKAK